MISVALFHLVFVYFKNTHPAKFLGMKLLRIEGLFIFSNHKKYQNGVKD